MGNKLSDHAAKVVRKSDKNKQAADFKNRLLAFLFIWLTYRNDAVAADRLTDPKKCYIIEKIVKKQYTVQRRTIQCRTYW